jgi:hypothetical protein
MPPAPQPEASWCPCATGGSGTSSAIRVGRAEILECIHLKLLRASCIPLCKATRPPVLWARAFCIVLKIFRAPGRASAMDRSSPRTVCHFLRLVRRCVRGIESRISPNHAILCSGRQMVSVVVSMIQPKTDLIVPHKQSPSLSFLIKTGSLRSGGSDGVNGRKMSSTA